MKKIISFIVSVILLSILSWTYHTTTTAKKMADSLCGTSGSHSFIILADKTVGTAELETALQKSDLKYTSAFKIDDTAKFQSLFWIDLLHSGASLAIGLCIFSLTYKLLNKKSEPIE